MKKSVILFIFFLLFAFYSCLVQKKAKEPLYDWQQSSILPSNEDSVSFPDTVTAEDGDARAGYEYLLHGNGFSSGIPLDLYKYVQWIKKTKLAVVTGHNEYVLNDFVVSRNEAGKVIATPGCLHCHSQQFNNKLVIGLGNSYSNFQTDKTEFLKTAERAIKFLYGKNSTEWKSAATVFESGYLLAPRIVTEMQGPTPAHRIAEFMASHRDPQTLAFRRDTSYFSIPPVVVPIDIPPLWVSKKKKSFSINGMQQGDLLKHLMSPTILTLKDTAEAKKIYNRIKDVWAYIKTLEPPQYPYATNRELVNKGKMLFDKNCSKCHGTYGENEWYPGQVIPGNTIGTDSLLLNYYTLYPEYAGWFNNSWFADSPSAFIRPQPGYIAPPLDGVWCTAPYFHNGSVPTIEAVLNSRKRPQYWRRSFTKEKYDYKNVGWRYKTLSKPGGKKTYDTGIPGYGNYGHYFGDHLGEEERKAVVEYLKTL